MALGTNVIARIGQTNAHFVAPVSITSEWATVIDASGMTTQDAATITNPDTQITASTRHILDCENRDGTIVQARMKYDAGATVSANPVVVAFGRTNGGPWERLPNLDDPVATAVTLTTDTTNDVSDGTYKYTHVNSKTHSWDRRGCNQILFGIQTVLAQSAGSTALALMQARAL